MSNLLLLSDVNKYLHCLGIPLSLDSAKANSLKSVVPNTEFSTAVLRAVEGDLSAKGWIMCKLRDAGLLQGNVSQPQQETAASAVNPNAQVNDEQEQAEPERPANEQEPEQERASHHVYGGQAALCFELDVTVSGFSTIALDGAKMVGKRKFDWANKLRVQLTKQELPIVTAVLLGMRQSCEFKNHGPDNNKGFALEHQDGKIYCKLFTKGLVVGVPITLSDAYYASVLFLKQLQVQTPWLDATSITMLLRSTLSK